MKLRSSYFDDGQYRYCSSEEIDDIEEWKKEQGTRVFMRDCLSLSMALDHNFKDLKGSRTSIGQLEYDGKYKKDQTSINKLADIVSKTIQDLPYYKEADFICSVPSHPDKSFDLPKSITALVSKTVGKPDITDGFVFGGEKPSIKESTLDKKWEGWERARVSFKNDNVNSKKIILIDDKYQSGITMQYIAMILQQAGAADVYGLCCVKTLRDTDNQQ